MTDYTHYLTMIFDGHGRGKRGTAPTNVDPVLGQILSVQSAPTPAAEVNVIVRGATSGAVGRIIRMIDAGTSFVIEAFEHPVFGIPGAAFTPGETINFDNGGTALASLVAAQYAYPITNEFALQQEDAPVNSCIPEDRSDNTFYDRTAKYARTVILDGATVGVGEIFSKGYRCTTSGGASFTILLGNVSGSDWEMRVIRVTGTLTVGHTVTNTTTGHVATIKSLPAAPAQGAWVPHCPIPNLKGLGQLWEFPPNGNGTDGQEPALGPDLHLLRGAYERYKASTSVADRGVRLVPYCVFDHHGLSDGVLGGMTVQVVKCSGTFPSTWTVGETVTSGSWSAKVHGFSASNKYLFVVEPNGQTLAAGTVTGGTSASVATSTGAALGWQKGSAFWNSMVAEITTAMGKENALWMGSAARHEGSLLMVWEAEIGTFATGTGCPWPDLTRMQTEWIRFLADFRAFIGRADLPITIWHGDSRSHPEVNLFGVPYAYLLRLMIGTLPGLVPGVTLTRTEGYEPAQTTSMPYSSSMLFHRPLDYLDVGKRAWRAINLVNTEIPTGDVQILPAVFVGGQSQLVGGIPSQVMMSIDRDPDLWPAHQDMGLGGFAGVSTVDENVLTFNTVSGEIEPLDILLNGNHFFGQPVGTCGPPVPLMQRMKGRFAAAGAYSGKVLLINLPVGASSCNAESDGSLATWDPDAAGQLVTTATCTVTAFAATSLLPQRGRFTAAAGTFDQWTVGASGFVAGSALGLVGFGGNNSLQRTVNAVHAKAGDGSWIELVGPYVNEGSRSFTLTKGPHPLWQLVLNAVRLAFLKAAQLNYLVWPALMVWENGESDLAKLAGYKAALLRVLRGIERIFGLRAKGQTAVAKVLVQLSAKTPWPVPDADVVAMRTVQAEVAAELENCALVDPSNLPMESNGTWPRLTRLDNGVHRTARGHIAAGFMIDAAAGTLAGIPAHPAGDSAVDFGAVDGGVPAAGAGSDGAESVGGGVDEVTPAQAAAASTAIGDALALQPDVAGYSVTRDGHSVTRRSLKDLIEAADYLEHKAARAAGLTHTLADFNS